MWDKCGMARNKKGLEEAIEEIKKLREEFWKDVRVTGDKNEFNPELEKAGRVADFLELGELMCMDALNRNESCGGHFREEFQTEEGEANRDDANYSYVAAWQNRQVNVRKQNTCKKYWQKIINAQKEKHKHSSIVI